MVWLQLTFSHTWNFYCPLLSQTRSIAKILSTFGLFVKCHVKEATSQLIVVLIQSRNSVEVVWVTYGLPVIRKSKILDSDSMCDFPTLTNRNKPWMWVTDALPTNGRLSCFTSSLNSTGSFCRGCLLLQPVMFCMMDLNWGTLLSFEYLSLGFILNPVKNPVSHDQKRILQTWQGVVIHIGLLFANSDAVHRNLERFRPPKALPWSSLNWRHAICNTCISSDNDWLQ